MSDHAGVEHHHKAAEHHEHAAKNHREAAKHHEAGDHEKAAHHAHTAHGHASHAEEHHAEASRHHAEHHGQHSLFELSTRGVAFLPTLSQGTAFFYRDRESCKIIAAPFSAIIAVGVLVLPDVIDGKTEASATRSPAIPR